MDNSNLLKQNIESVTNVAEISVEKLRENSAVYKRKLAQVRLKRFKENDLNFIDIRKAEKDIREKIDQLTAKIHSDFRLVHMINCNNTENFLNSGQVLKSANKFDQIEVVTNTYDLDRLLGLDRGVFFSYGQARNDYIVSERKSDTLILSPEQAKAILQSQTTVASAFDLLWLNSRFFKGENKQNELCEIYLNSVFPASEIS